MRLGTQGISEKSGWLIQIKTYWKQIGNPHVMHLKLSKGLYKANK
jgi:hypothetical protein